MGTPLLSVKEEEKSEKSSQGENTQTNFFKEKEYARTSINNSPEI